MSAATTTTISASPRNHRSPEVGVRPASSTTTTYTAATIERSAATETVATSAGSAARATDGHRSESRNGTIATSPASAPSHTATSWSNTASRPQTTAMPSTAIATPHTSHRVAPRMRYPARRTIAGLVRRAASAGPIEISTATTTVTGIAATTGPHAITGTD